MARAHAANACVQSDSIKGLAQSIAKPAYHRLLTAEPALRRAVPTLIIAFLITICLGAFVQVIDQSRQKRAADEARPLRAHRHAGRTPRPPRLRPAGPRRQHRAAAEPAARPDSRPGASPPAATSSSPAPTPRFSPAFPSTEPWRHRPHSRRHQHRAIAGRARPAGRRQRHDAAERQGAMAISRLVKALPGQVIVIQEKIEPIWGSDAASR